MVEYTEHICLIPSVIIILNIFKTISLIWQESHFAFKVVQLFFRETFSLVRRTEIDLKNADIFQIYQSLWYERQFYHIYYKTKLFFLINMYYVFRNDVAKLDHYSLLSFINCINNNDIKRHSDNNGLHLENYFTIFPSHRNQFYK